MMREPGIEALLRLFHIALRKSAIPPFSRLVDACLELHPWHRVLPAIGKDASSATSAKVRQRQEDEEFHSRALHL
jgi:hypothetical protein